MSKIIQNCVIFTGESVLREHCIVVKDGYVADICYGYEVQNEGIQIIDLKGKCISPGFIDAQINGGKQLYFAENHDEAALQDMYDACLEYGTPFILPTLISSPLQDILGAIASVRSFRQKNPGVIGMHLEGPFINPKKKGAHSQEVIRKPSDQQLRKIIQMGKDVIKVITIAPECFSEEQLDLLIESGIEISIGHTDVSYAQIQQYFKKGITLVTHLYNSMNQMGQRECGAVGAILDNEDIYASIILDGGHCHEVAARVAYRQKKNKLFLISDSSFLGRYKKQYRWKRLSIQMRNGFYRDKEGNLAGAAISMPEALKNAQSQLRVSLQEAVEMCTSCVARAIKIDTEIGFIKIGYPAMFTVFDQNLEEVSTLIL